MSVVAVFHSVMGLRPVEAYAADRLRAAGHEVVTPDLYAGASAETAEEGFRLNDRIGWSVVVERAHDALRSLPGDTVLVGISMGASVVEALLPHRPDTAGVLLLLGLAQIPEDVRRGLPVQVHLADPDPFAPPEAVAAWRAAAAASPADTRVHLYPGAGHFYLDPSLPDHDEPAAALTWRRATAFLDAL